MTLVEDTVAHHPHHPDHAHHPPDPGGPAPWSILVLLVVAQFMVVLDVTVVNVALPAIGADLAFAAGDLQWVVTIYVLMAGGLLLLGGRAADLLGRRSVFLAGLLTFGAASLASGLAASPEALILSRAAQGAGAALLTPAALSIIVTTYTGAQHTTALAAWGAVGSGGAAAGMLFGGMLTTWLSWEWVFLINVPVALVAAVLVPRVVPATPVDAGARRRGLDVRGGAAVVAGLVVLVYALEGTAEHGWGATRTLLLLAAAAGLLGAFAGLERRARNPLVPPRTWRVRSLVSGAGVMFGVTGVLVGLFFLNSLYLQRTLGASALETGLAFLPIAVAIAFAAHVAAHVLPQAGARAIATAGLLVTAAGAVLMGLAPDDAGYATDLLPGFVLLGLGVGLVFPSVSITAMHEVGHDGAGLASGLMATAHEIGAALGVAVLSAVAATGALAGLAGAGGYEDGVLAAAGIAAGLALLAAIALPAVRPAPGVRVGVH